MKRTEQFQGLKLLFVLSIVVMHAGSPVLGNGADLCSFFFVISGFFYKGDTVGYRKYIWRKISALLPLQWVCLGGIILVSHLSVYWDVIPHLFLFQSYIPYKHYEFFNYNGVAWFLSSLLFCYAVSPVVYRYILKVRNKILLLLLLLVTILVLYYCVYNEYRTWFIYISPIFRLIEYSLGITLRRVVDGRGNKLVVSEYVIIILFGVYLLLLRFGVFSNTSAILHVALIALLFWNPETFVTRILSLKGVMWLSKYCIYIYMSHCVFLALFANIAFMRIPLVLLCSLCFGVGYEYVCGFVKRLSYR